MLDRYLLRYFLAVVDQGSFSRAAQYCHVSQPTLSVGIAKLERALGSSLFVRSSKRIELTQAGSRFVTHARRIEREFNVAQQSMGRTEDLPSLRLGIISTIPGDLIASAIARTRPEQSHRFELIIGSERELTSHLARGRVDVALTLIDRGADRFLEKPIAVEGYALAMPDGHPLAAYDEIAAEQLASETMIVRRHCEALSDTSRFFTERGVRPHFALRTTNDELVLQMVAAGLGITVMPECYRREGVVRPRLTGFAHTRVLGWAANHDAESLLGDPPLVLADLSAQFASSANDPRRRARS